MKLIISNFRQLHFLSQKLKQYQEMKGWSTILTVNGRDTAERKINDIKCKMIAKPRKDKPDWLKMSRQLSIYGLAESIKSTLTAVFGFTNCNFECSFLFPKCEHSFISVRNLGKISFNLYNKFYWVFIPDVLLLRLYRFREKKFPFYLFLLSLLIFSLLCNLHLPFLVFYVPLISRLFFSSLLRHWIRRPVTTSCCLLKGSFTQEFTYYC